MFIFSTLQLFSIWVTFETWPGSGIFSEECSEKYNAKCGNSEKLEQNNDCCTLEVENKLFSCIFPTVLYSLFHSFSL